MNPSLLPLILLTALLLSVLWKVDWKLRDVDGWPGFTANLVWLVMLGGTAAAFGDCPAVHTSSKGSSVSNHWPDHLVNK